MTYEQAKGHARHFACVTKCDYGIMREVFGGCMVFILPPEARRCGSELTCEVVRYADITPAERQLHLELDEQYGDGWRIAAG